jgi:hypothetical protein
MRTADIISRLVDDLRPVRPLRPVHVRLAQWSVVVLAVLGLEVLVAFARGIDLSGVIQATWLSHAVPPLSIALVAAAAALRHSIPGRAHPSLLAASSLLVALWVGWLARAVAVDPFHSFPAWMAAPAARCAAHVAAAGIPGGLALLWLVRAGVPLSGAQSGILIALAAGASGALATHLTCPNQSPAHLLLWHAGSVLSIAISGIKMRRLVTL